jgi:glycerol kinase
MENTYGTGAFALLNTGKRRIRSKHGLITTIGCDARGGPAYVLEGAIFIAGAAIQWLRDGLHLFESARETADLARSIPDNGGVYFVPALTGLGAPHWEPEARGCISGLTRGTTDAHLVRAALEAMAYQTRDVLEAMEKDSGLTVRRLKVGGGAAANDFLCQFQADLLGRPVVRAAHTESTALGAAYLAGLATGYWKSSRDITATWKQDREFSPVLSPAEAMSLYKGWKTALKRTVL